MAKINVENARRGMTRRTLLIIGISSAVIIGFVLFSTHGVVTRIRLSAEASELQSRVATMKHTEDSLRTAIRTLESDSAEIERIARERYGYIRPGERVYIIERDSSN
ncbi:MAG: septum formation initiator family protein [Bradyrhizobiaceae bacterium]|nr:septum formation initiator family protein [Bradyrhizobiaceae bacterium]